MFDIRKSKKAYIESPEHYIVVKDNVVYLRVVGEEPNYQIMTATAGEDSGNIRASSDQRSLIEAAMRVSAEVGIHPSVKEDYADREYVEICNCEYLSDVYRASEKLFKKLNENSASRSESDMRSIYTSLAFDESGGDIYLSDGVWLSIDGSLTDQGR